MSSNIGIVFGFLALIISAGVGGYFGYLQYSGALAGSDGDDGDDGIDGQDATEIDYIYYCSSRSEIVSAISSIGSGSGTIIITQNIEINSPIYVNYGGNYVIQGMGSCIIDITSNLDGTFRLTSADSCIIRDLTFDASSVYSGYPIIQASEPVTIENVRFLGHGTSSALGVSAENDDYVIVKGCYFEDLYKGIETYYADYCQISENTFVDITTNAIEIDSTTNYCTIEENFIEDVMRGIEMQGSYNAIKNNLIYDISDSGIRLNGGSYNIVLGNLVNGDSDPTNNVFGIYATSSSDGNSITQNYIGSLWIGSGGDGTPIQLESGCDYNLVRENYLFNNENNVVVNYDADNDVADNYILSY